MATGANSRGTERHLYTSTETTPDSGRGHDPSADPSQGLHREYLWGTGPEKGIPQLELDENRRQGVATKG